MKWFSKSWAVLISARSCQFEFVQIHKVWRFLDGLKTKFAKKMDLIFCNFSKIAPETSKIADFVGAATPMLRRHLPNDSTGRKESIGPVFSPIWALDKKLQPPQVWVAFFKYFYWSHLPMAWNLYYAAVGFGQIYVHFTCSKKIIPAYRLFF